MEFVTDPDDQGSAMAVDDVDTPEIFGEGVIVPLTLKINAWNSTFLSCLEFDIITGRSHSGDKEEHKRSKLLLDFLSFSASSFSSMARFSVVTDKVSMEVVEEFILEQLNLTKGTISEIKHIHLTG
ncbi:hypothetical protein E1A91_D01G155000v1 [Gossypium mustelinum]|uniref:Uncharacterized protein n=1 Tax=Gossypium mustelinum TaxID=34275 RepID=A0A5D2W7R1_GOSMU|nr:hypothetical protein E1A91_D01G155000v1 [Gossypium mustelinum]